MKPLILIALSSVFLFGCKVTTNTGGNSPGSTDNKGGGNTAWEKGGSLGEDFLEIAVGARSLDSIYGLWRNEPRVIDGLLRQEAVYFEKDKWFVSAAKCEKFGITAYALTQAPIQLIRDKITITKAYGYEATEKNLDTGEAIKCPAEIRKGQMYFSIDNKNNLCLSTLQNCKGSLSKFNKIRDVIR